MNKEAKKSLAIFSGAMLASTLACTTYVGSSISPTETPTNDSANTLTPSLTPDWQQTINAAVNATNTEEAQQTLIAQGQISPKTETPVGTGVFATSTVAPKETQVPTSTQTVNQVPATLAPITPGVSDTQEKFSNDQAYPGEFTFNNLKKVHPQSVALRSAIVNRLVSEMAEIEANPDRKDEILRRDSTLSSLINPLSKGTSDDPIKEPGLSQNSNDFRGYGNIEDIMANRKTIAVSALLHINANGVLTMGGFSDADDRDAMLGVMGVAKAFHDNPEAFEGIDTLDQALRNPQILKYARANQSDFISEIQKKELRSSDAETKRRTDKDQSDMSVQIGAVLWRSDNWQSCDVYRPEKDKRFDQLQDTRLVTHQDGNPNEFTSSNSAAENHLYVLAIDKDGKWDIDGFTIRGYKGSEKGKEEVVQGQEESVVVEEMRHCGIAVPAKKKETKPAQKAAPVQPRQPEQPPAKPTNTPAPTNVDILPTVTKNRSTDIPPTPFG